MIRLVIDASVLASAAVGFPDSPSALLLDAVRAGRVEIVACDRLLDEVDRALRSRYFQSRVTADERVSVASLLRAIALVVADPVDPPRLLRDPSDDYLVMLARDTSSEAIVTGDRDLLDHDDHCGTLLDPMLRRFPFDAGQTPLATGRSSCH